MQLIRNGEGISFQLSTKVGAVGIGSTGKSDISVFLTDQGNDQENMLHWPGEYEINGLAFLIAQPVGSHSVVKIFSEGVRFAFFNDDGVKEVSDDLIAGFGNTDVLVIEKSDNGLSKGDMKKLIEKIDPRMIVIPQGSTVEVFKDYNLPFSTEEKLNISYSGLPKEHSEYVIL